MDKLADPDTSFLVPCMHCDALLQESERFCPSCGEDQLFYTAAATVPVQPAAVTGLPHADAAQGVGWLRPRTDDVPDARIGPAPPPEDMRSPGWRPSAIAVLGVVAALVMVAFASMWGIDRYGMRDQAGRERTPEATVAQLRAALDRDDLAAAERAFATLDATQVGTPALQALKQNLDQRVLAQAQRREQLSNAAQNASRSLGFGGAAEAGATSAGITANAAPSRPASPVAPPKDCNDALAALALCKPQ